MNTYYKIIVIFLIMTVPAAAQKAIKIKPVSKFNIEVPEPSDITFSPDNNSLFIVSDKGYLYETDLQGKIIRKANFSGIDCEGVCIYNNEVYVAEESVREITKFDIKNLNQLRNIEIPYHGARNKGYESITYNYKKDCFIVITEQSPSNIYELDDNLIKTNEIDISPLARDISSATYYNDFLWLLSDEDQLIIKVDPKSYKSLAKWTIPVINPEGIAFNTDGKVLIVSDGMQKLFYFESLDK